MACYHPLKGFIIGKTKNGKDLYKITGFLTDHLEQDFNGNWYSISCETIGKNAKRYIKSYTTIPCGKCIGCRLEYTKQWATRCMLELPYHSSSYFVTLTYNDDYLPVNHYINEDGEIKEHMTLKKSDLQKFFKRLRINYERLGYDNHLKFYSCGEYGDRHGRPHYHCIIFGLQLDDLRLDFVSPLGHRYYKSDFLNKCWPFGFVTVGEVTFETCSYTARYIMKKQIGENAHIYEDEHFEPEFTTMSLRPAIGYDYFKDNWQTIYDTDEVFISTSDGGKKFKPPRYFDSKLENIDSNILKNIKDIRKTVAENTVRQKCSNSSLSYLEILEVEENILKKRLKSLVRKEF